MTFFADDKCCVIQYAAMEPSPGTRPILPELAPGTERSCRRPRASWRAWHGGVSGSLMAPVTLRQLRMLAVLADPWRTRSVQMPRAPYWRHR